MLDAHLVVRGIDQDFVNNLEKARDVCDLLVDHSLGVRVPDPHLLRDTLDAADVGVGAQEDVLKLRQLRRHEHTGKYDSVCVGLTFWYVSDAVFFFDGARALGSGAGSSAPSLSMSLASFSLSAALFFFVAAAVFAGLAAFLGAITHRPPPIPP